jgi:hypothetical protein
MEKIKIEKGIPLQPRSTGKSNPNSYPFGDMFVGDSFFVSGEGSKNLNILQTQIMQAVRLFKAGKGDKIGFSSRIVDNGVRVWRVK